MELKGDGFANQIKDSKPEDYKGTLYKSKVQDFLKDFQLTPKKGTDFQTGEEGKEWFIEQITSQEGITREQAESYITFKEGIYCIHID